MFSKKISSLPALTVLQQAIICLFFFFLLLPIIIFTLRQGLQQTDNELCDATLATFFSTYQQQGALGLQKRFAGTASKKTTFLRLQTKKDQLLLLTDIHGVRSTGLPDFTSLAPTVTGTWIQLDQHISEYWTIRLSILPDGDILQVGFRTTDAVLLYNRLKKNLLITWLFLSPVSVLPVWFMFHRNQRVMTRLSQKIAATALDATDSHQSKARLTPGEAGLVETISHLTTRHQALVRQLQETMDNVAHDLRTPLARLRTIAEYGLQEKGNPKQLRERLTDCLEESDRVLSMLNTMLNVAEAEAKSMVLDLQPVDLRKAIDEVVELYAIVAEEKNCSLIILDSKPVIALVDPNRIGQVWANLIDNAIKYGATKIEITLRQENSRAVVTVYDNGMGISKTEKDQIWNRLFRGDRSRSQPGLGLGLTLVRAIIMAHAGSITVDSKLNTATTFTVQLPQPPTS